MEIFHYNNIANIKQKPAIILYFGGFFNQNLHNRKCNLRLTIADFRTKLPVGHKYQ